MTIDNVSLVANYITWDNDSGDGLWTTATNWYPDGVPGISDRVLVETGVVASAQNEFAELYIEEGASVTFAEDLQTGNSALWSNATYNIDIAEYHFTNGSSMVLADYASHVAAFDGTFNPTVNIITGTGVQELGGSLSFNTTESQLVLTITDFVNDAPVAGNLSFGIPVGDEVAFTLPARDLDDQALTYTIVGGPTNGTLSGTAPDLSYTPAVGWAGEDEITFTAHDGTLLSNTGTVFVYSMPETAAEVWSMYDDAIRNDPVNVEWLTSWTNGNIAIWQIRYDLGTMVGTRTNAAPKMAAFYAYPIGETDLPGIVQIHGGGQKGDAALAQFWAEHGYAAISINWGTGELLGGFPNTDWDGLPAGQYHPGTDFQNWTDPHATATHASLYDVSHPLNSSWMLNSYDCGFDLAMPAGYTDPTRTFSVASEVSLVYPPELANNGIVATAKKVRLIDDFSRGYHDWFWRWAGAANWQCSTRKVTDPSWQGQAGAELTLDVVTTTAGNTLGIKLNTVAWHEASANTYTASVALPVAGTNSISLSVSDFMNGQAAELTTWGDATWLQFSSASGYAAWTGLNPEFKNVRWVGGDYPNEGTMFSIR